MTWMTGQIAPLAYSQTIQTCKKGLIDQTIVGDLDRLEKCANRNITKFNNSNWKALHLGRNNSIHEDRGVENSFAKKDVQVKHNPAMHPCKKHWGCLRKNCQQVQGGDCFLLLSGTYWTESSEGP